IRADLPESAEDETRLAFHDGDEATEAETRVADRIGKYEITGELAVGGMGRLLLARHPEIDKKFVIKTAKAGLLTAGTQVLDRLRREAVILGRLEHDRICPVTDVIIESRRIY